MLQQESRFNTTDNSGAKELLCIKVLGGNKKYAKIGDKVIVTVKSLYNNSNIKKGTIYKAVIVRSKKGIKRKDGSYIKFDDNAAVLLTKNNELIGTRIFGPVTKELKNKNFIKIISLAPEVL